MPKKRTKLAGPFSPEQKESCFFALYADDCLLHFRADELTPKQQEDHEANVVLTAMLQVALTYMGRHKDHAALHDEFKKDLWAKVLTFYNSTFERLFSDVIPPENYHYFPRDGFYEAAADCDLPGQLLSLYMISGSNLCLHQSQEDWALSQKVNSKMHFANTAPAAGVVVPETRVTTKLELDRDGPEFFSRHPNGVMVKVLGLAGSRNVERVNTLQEAQDYLEEYDDDLEVLLQQALAHNEFTEMTVDLDVSDDGISITNVRKILFAEGLWVGNHISPTLALTPQQETACINVGRYVREQGYTSERGYNCGIDFFVRGDELIVIEINARWTGGLFPTQLLKRLGAQNEESVAFIDTISVAALPHYQEYLAANLSAQNKAANGFRIVPMGFSPFVQSLDDTDKIFVWQVVIGDFEAFKKHKDAVQGLGKHELSTANLISLA